MSFPFFPQPSVSLPSSSKVMGKSRGLGARPTEANPSLRGGDRAVRSALFPSEVLAQAGSQELPGAPRQALHPIKRN